MQIDGIPINPIEPDKTVWNLIGLFMVFVVGFFVIFNGLPLLQNSLGVKTNSQIEFPMRINFSGLK